MMKNYPALTIKQPWAGLIMLGIKDVENRSWITSYRGPLFVHAGMKWDDTELTPDQFRTATQQIASNKEDHIYGKIIGVVDLVAIVDDSTSVWARKGDHHWLLSNPRSFAAPIPWRGQMSLWWPTRFTQ